jgi:hypothetical protein
MKIQSQQTIFAAAAWILAGLTSSAVGAFSLSPHQSSRRRASLSECSATRQQDGLVDRKGFLGSALVAGGLLLSPTMARADVTSKVASSAALRKVKSSQKKLASMESLVEENDYTEVKEAIREAPFSDIRKSCTTLIKGGEDGPDFEELQVRYKTFVTKLEKMDGNASVAMRGRTLPAGEFVASYQATVEALANFLEMAQDAVEIPMSS